RGRVSARSWKSSRSTPGRSKRTAGSPKARSMKPPRRRSCARSCSPCCATGVGASNGRTSLRGGTEVGRHTPHRWTLTGDLVTLDAIHVGGLDPHPLYDQSLARDGQGRLYLPGTSLTGVLRTLCRREAG